MTDSQLVDGPRLLELLFDKKCRPSLRWLEMQKSQGRIPFAKIGRKVFYDPAQVRTALYERKP